MGWLTSGNMPGRTLRDLGLKMCGWGGKLYRRSRPTWYKEFHEGSGAAPTPGQMGVPKWQGTAEENARMVRAALRISGASTVGFVELTEKTKKLIWTNVYHPPFAPYVFEEADHPVAAPDKAVIPNKCKYAIVYTTRQSLRT